jgi:hypothetical protein
MPNKKVSQLTEAPFQLDDKIVINQSGVTKVLKTENLPGALDKEEDKVYGYTNGKLTSVTGADVTKTFVYNVQDQLESVTTTSASKVVTKTFTYDGNGNLIAVTIS